MGHTRLLFGKPLVKDSKELISAVRALQSRTGCVIQIFDADKVASERHLIFAIEKALAAFSEERNIAKDLGVEILRYASGERQIERALSMGVSGSTKRVALAIIRPEFAEELAWPDSPELSRLIEVDGMGASFKLDALRETFNISEDEIRAADETRIPDLVIERVALVDTIR
jgi:KEOPS complex subunit Cgi121